MKFVRFGKPGDEKPGMIDPQGGIRDISTYVTDINPNSLSDPFILQQFAKFDWTALPLVDSNVRIGPCVGSIGKIICIGFNSQQHALEMGVKRSEKSEPILFLKPSDIDICIQSAAESDCYNNTYNITYNIVYKK